MAPPSALAKATAVVSSSSAFGSARASGSHSLNSMRCPSPASRASSSVSCSGARPGLRTDGPRFRCQGLSLEVRGFKGTEHGERARYLDSDVERSLLGADVAQACAVIRDDHGITVLAHY